MGLPASWLSLSHCFWECNRNFLRSRFLFYSLPEFFSRFFWYIYIVYTSFGQFWVIRLAQAISVGTGPWTRLCAMRLLLPDLELRTVELALLELDQNQSTLCFESFLNGTEYCKQITAFHDGLMLCDWQQKWLLVFYCSSLMFFPFGCFSSSHFFYKSLSEIPSLTWRTTFEPCSVLFLKSWAWKFLDSHEIYNGFLRELLSLHIWVWFS